jgi:Tfp pilus assembly protein PilO
VGPLLAKMRTLDAKYIYALVAGVVAVIVLVDVLLLMLPQVRGLVVLEGKVVQLKTDITTLETNVQRLPIFEKQLDETRAQLKDIERMIHRKNDIPMVLKRISSAANETGVKIDQMMPQQDDKPPLIKAEDGDYMAQTIFVGARSGFHDFGRFLAMLENERVFWKADDVTIKADEIDMRRPVFKMSMKIIMLDK